MEETEHFHYNVEEKAQQGIIGKTQRYKDQLLQTHAGPESLPVIIWVPSGLDIPILPALLPVCPFFLPLSLPQLSPSHFKSAALKMDIQGPGIPSILKFPWQLDFIFQDSNNGLSDDSFRDFDLTHITWHQHSLKIELCDPVSLALFMPVKPVPNGFQFYCCLISCLLALHFPRQLYVRSREPVQFKGPSLQWIWIPISAGPLSKVTLTSFTVITAFSALVWMFPSWNFLCHEKAVPYLVQPQSYGQDINKIKPNSWPKYHMSGLFLFYRVFDILCNTMMQAFSPCICLNITIL